MEDFFSEWVIREQHLLNDLLSVPQDRPDLQIPLISRTLNHYSDYCRRKSQVAERDIFQVFSPHWMTSLERSFLWIGGEKPCVLLRLIPTDLTLDQPRQVDQLRQVWAFWGGGIQGSWRWYCTWILGFNRWNPRRWKKHIFLAAAVTLAERGGGPVIYISGEESITQIADRASRMGISKKDILLCSNTNIEDILEKSRAMDPNPTALIIDSIQTTYMRGLHGSAGNPTQMKRCMSELLQYANETNIPVIVIGHVTKMGTLAGPRTLEHMVDVVLYVETERHSTYRLLRCVKNRFGSTDELGIFEMSKTGLQVALNTRDMFSRDPDPEAAILAGRAFGVMIDESRTSIVEVQALCFSIPHSKEKVHVNGVQKTRAKQIIMVISMQTPLTPKNYIYLNVLSGVKLSGSAVDLPIAAAICSGCFGCPIPNDIAFIGEIGLEGELRTVPRIDKRVKGVANLEFKKCIVPKESKKLLDELDLNIKILYCKNLIEVIETVFPFTKEKKYDSESGLMKKGI